MFSFNKKLSCKAIRSLILVIYLPNIWYLRLRDDRARIPSVKQTVFIICEYITTMNTQIIDQLTVDLITQLVKHCTDIVAVIVLDPVQA